MNNNFLHRTIQDRLILSMVPGNVIVLLGPRRVGKTVLINKIIEKLNEPYLLQLT